MKKISFAMLSVFALNANAAFVNSSVNSFGSTLSNLTCEVPHQFWSEAGQSVRDIMPSVSKAAITETVSGAADQFLASDRCLRVCGYTSNIWSTVRDGAWGIWSAGVGAVSAMVAAHPYIASFASGFALCFVGSCVVYKHAMSKLSKSVTSAKNDEVKVTEEKKLEVKQLEVKQPEPVKQLSRSEKRHLSPRERFLMHI